MKTNRCAQRVAKIGEAAYAASVLTKNDNFVIEQIQKGGLKLTIEKCQFGKHSMEILEKTKSTARRAPIRE